jgi:hypothetical protein
VTLRDKRVKSLFEEAMAIWEPPETAATATAATAGDQKEMKRTTPYLVCLTAIMLPSVRIGCDCVIIDCSIRDD